MSEQQQDGQQQVDTGQPEEGEQSPGDLRRMLSESRAEAKEAKAELATIRRDQAFTQAGIPADGAGALVRKAYDGDADPEAIRAFAAEHGITPTGSEQAETATVSGQQPDHQEAPPADVVAAAQAIDQATGVPTPPPAESPLDTQLAQANSLEEIEQIARQAGLTPAE